MSYKKIYHSYPEACTGCRVCEIICSLKHEKIGVNPKRSMIKILDIPEKGIFIPNTCQQCEDAPCIDVCPEDAISQDNQTGVIHVDEENCSGCKLCIDACKFDTIFLHPEKNIVQICYLCGGNPMCIKYCLQEAIVFLTPEEYEHKKNDKIKSK